MQTLMHLPCVSLFSFDGRCRATAAAIDLIFDCAADAADLCPAAVPSGDRDAIIKRQSFYVKRFTFDERRTNVKRLK